MFLILENGSLKESTALDVLGIEPGDSADYDEDVLRPAGFFPHCFLGSNPSLGSSLQVYRKDSEKKGASRYKFLVDYDIGDSYIHSVGVSSDLELHMVLAIVVPIVSGMAALVDMEDRMEKRT